MEYSWSGRRDHLLFLFLYNTEARVSQVLSVRVQDVQRDDCRAVQLLGKAKRNERCPSGRTASDPAEIDGEIHTLCDALIAAEGRVVP